MSARIAVLGGGAWGTALATTCATAGNAVRLWGRDASVVAAINERRENPRYLPDIALDSRLEATTDPGIALEGAECVLAVTPAQTMRDVIESLSDRVPAGMSLVLCAKGIERETGRLLSDVVEEVLPGVPVAALSGPSFATDLAQGMPTAVTIAAKEASAATRLAGLLSAPNLRCYSSDDLVGVEVGGALKNVMAIAAGAVSGAGLGASAQAAMVTRGFVELRRIGAAFGARPDTLMGLSGLGDLILTCGSAQSRNFAYGLALGRGESREGLKLAEGVATADIAARLATDRGIDAPITQAVSRILTGETTIGEAVRSLLARPLKSEAG